MQFVRSCISFFYKRYSTYPPKNKSIAEEKWRTKPGKTYRYRLICGTYDNRFWGYLTPEAIDWALSNEPDKEYPEALRNYNPDTGNPIIVFYEVLK